MTYAIPLFLGLLAMAFAYAFGFAAGEKQATPCLLCKSAAYPRGDTPWNEHAWQCVDEDGCKARKEKTCPSKNA